MDLAKVKEIFVDASHNISKSNAVLQGIVAEEYGWGIPVGFMLMDVPQREDEQDPEVRDQAMVCNKNFYAKARELGMNPDFVHTDKDYSEINAARVYPFWVLHLLCRVLMCGRMLLIVCVFV